MDARGEPRGKWTEHDRFSIVKGMGAVTALLLFIALVTSLTGRYAIGEWDTRILLLFLPMVAIVDIVGYLIASHFIIHTDFETSLLSIGAGLDELVGTFQEAMESMGIRYERYTAAEYRTRGANPRWRREPAWIGTNMTGWYKYDLNGGDMLASITVTTQGDVERGSLQILHLRDRDQFLVDGLKRRIDGLIAAGRTKGWGER